MSPVLLQGAGVEKRFGRVPALRGIDFEIRAGEAVSILGANGAGKSTLLRILAGLSRPSRGQFQALRIHRENPDANRRTEDSQPQPQPLTREALRGEVGYVGHATLVYAELTARENLAFAAQLHGRTPNLDQIDALLSEVGLIEFADRRAGEFSRGMAQRLSIARAIVHEPQLLLLDEPFTGLDESSAERLSNQLARLRNGERTLILVTHDPQRAIELSDRALILDRGKVCATPGHSMKTGEAADSSGAFELASLRETLQRLSSRDGPLNGRREIAS
ncbi:MAG: ABC transporter ATP-binding protein [Myxococcota bacterium]